MLNSKNILFHNHHEKGNILSFAKGIGVHFDMSVTCRITNMDEIGGMAYKSIKFAAFDMMFKTNVSLPNYIGLGKGVSHGFGTIVQMKMEEFKD
jgi:hypothetical protein